jgi:hypothetical protein
MISGVGGWCKGCWCIGCWRIGCWRIGWRIGCWRIADWCLSVCNWCLGVCNWGVGIGQWNLVVDYALGKWLSDDRLMNNALDERLVNDRLLNDLRLRLMNDLFLYSLVLNAFDYSLLRDVLHIAIMEDLRMIFGLVLNGVMFDNLSFAGDVFDSGHGFVLND